MKPAEFLNELSNKKLGDYKKAAGADATAADKEGDYKRGDKRMSGIIKATKKEFANDKKKKDVAEAGNNYHANRTGFTRGARDDERHDLDTPKPTSPEVWGLKINGKVWSKGGKDVTFTSKQAALNTRNAILKNRPDLEIGLVTKGGSPASGAQSKTDDNFRAYLAQRKAGEEQLDEIIDPSTALAKALRYVGRKFAQTFPLLAVGGVGAGLAASGLMAPIVASMGGISTALSALSAEMAFSAGMAGTYAAPSIIQTIKDLFAADENSIQAGIKRWVEKYVGDDNDVQEFMLVHSKAAYEGKPGFRWRAKQWPVKMTREQAEAYLEKNDKSWLDFEKQKAIDAEKAKAEQGTADMSNIQKPMNEGVPSDNDMGIVPDVRSGTSTKMTLGQWKQMWLKKMPHADQGMFRYPPAMNGSFIAYFDGWENTPGARWDPQQSVSEEQLDENLHKWFKEKWVRFGPDGKIRGDCARGDDSEGKPKCLPQSKAHSLGKKGRASAASRKRREDPNPERSGKAINVNTKKKTDEAIDRRGFLKGLGAAAVAGAAGDAMASNKKEPTKHHPQSEIKFFDYETLRAVANKLDVPRNPANKWAFGTTWYPNGKGIYINFNMVQPGSKSERQGYQNYAEILPEKIIHDELTRVDNQRKSGQQRSQDKAKNSGLLDSVQQGVAEEQLDELSCWSGYHRVAGTKAGFPGSCAKNKTNEESLAEEEEDKMDSRFKKTEWMPLMDAIKILKHYGATPEKYMGHEMFPYYDIEGNRKYLEDITWNADNSKNVRVSLVNQAVRELKAQKQGVAESNHSESCPHCGGEMVSEELMNEKKDACYYKVKSRYKVWPSAYASGALVKCRKKGADSWGNGGKKNESSIMQGLNQLDEGWREKIGAAALAGSMALGAAGANARVTPDGQGGFTGGLKPTATVVAPDNTPSATLPTASSDSSDPFKGLARADSADRQAKTITVGGKEYGLVEISPTDIRPRSGKQIVVPQAVLGERGIGNYMGILVGDRVFVISKK